MEFKQIEAQIKMLQTFYKFTNAKEQQLLIELQVIKKQHAEMLEMLKKVLKENHCTPDMDKEIEQLIKEATEI